MVVNNEELRQVGRPSAGGRQQHGTSTGRSQQRSAQRAQLRHKNHSHPLRYKIRKNNISLEATGARIAKNSTALNTINFDWEIIS
jgi:hypothetical protein